MSEQKNLAKDLLEVLRWHADNQEDVYVNPHFLNEINGLIDAYYNIEDDVVDKYINNMFGM